MYAETDLARAKIARDNAMAAAADEKMRRAAESFYATEEERLAYDRRWARRRTEKTGGLQHAIPPGPWDEDLDTYPMGSPYEVPLGGGYKATLSRGWSTWAWYAKVTLPEGHCCHGVTHEEFDSREGRLAFLGGGPPIKLTFSQPAEGVFEFNHSSKKDGWPHRPWIRGDETEGCGVYMDFAAVLKEVCDTADFFRRLERDYREEIIETLKEE
jgi:hypothetical protein